MTADCSPSWTSWTIKIYVSFKLFSFVPESKFSYLSQFTIEKKNIYIYTQREGKGERERENNTQARRYGISRRVFKSIAHE